MAGGIGGIFGEALRVLVTARKRKNKKLALHSIEIMASSMTFVFAYLIVPAIAFTIISIVYSFIDLHETDDLTSAAIFFASMGIGFAVFFLVLRKVVTRVLLRVMITLLLPK
ncbi:MAG: hypothetical protein RLZZ380_168 [Actinomycetota bacterium]|jgi:hypothetical protein